MLTTGSKLYFGLGTLSLSAAVVYGWGSRGGLTGSLTVGLDGGVGELTGYTVLLAVAAISFFVAGAVVAFRDADAQALAEVAGTQRAPALGRASGSYWPALAAAGAGVIVLGAVINTQLFLLGGIVAFIALVEWMVSAWADRSTGDPVVNRRIRNRIMYPLEIPVFGAIGIAALVLSISRVLLALSKNGSAVLAIVFAISILAIATAVAASPRAGRTALTVLVALGVVGVLAGGILAAAKGERVIRPGEEKPGVVYTAPDRNQPLASEPTGSATTTTVRK